MKSIYPNGILEHVFNHTNQDKQIIQNWLLDGSPLSDETFQQTKDQQNHIKIISHEAFKFQC